MSKKYAREGLRRDRNLTDIPDSYTSLSHLLDDLAIPGQTFTPDDIYSINRLSKGFMDNEGFKALAESAFKSTQIKYLTDVVLSVANEDDWSRLFEGYFIETTGLSGDKIFYKIEAIQNKRTQNPDDPNTRYLANVKLSSDQEAFPFVAGSDFSILGTLYVFEEVSETNKTQSFNTLEPNITIKDQINYAEAYTGKNFLNGGNGAVAKFYPARFISENITTSTATEDLVTSDAKFFGPDLFYDDGTFLFSQKLYNNELFDDNGGLIQWEGYFANESVSPYSSFKISTNGYYRVEYSSDNGETWTLASQSVTDTYDVTRLYNKYRPQFRSQSKDDQFYIEVNSTWNGQEYVYNGTDEKKTEIESRERKVAYPFELAMKPLDSNTSPVDKLYLSKDDFVNIPEGGATIERSDLRLLYDRFSTNTARPELRDPDFTLDPYVEEFVADSIADTPLTGDDGGIAFNYPVYKKTENDLIFKVNNVVQDTTHYLNLGQTAGLGVTNALETWAASNVPNIQLRDYFVSQGSGSYAEFDPTPERPSPNTWIWSSSDLNNPTPENTTWSFRSTNPNIPGDTPVTTNFSGFQEWVADFYENSLLSAQFDIIKDLAFDTYDPDPNLDMFNQNTYTVSRLSPVGGDYPVQDIIYVPNDMDADPKKIRTTVWWPESSTPYQHKIVEFLPGVSYGEDLDRTQAIPQNYWYDELDLTYDESSRKFIKRIKEEVLDRKQTVMNKSITSNDLTVVSYQPPLTNLDSNFKVLYQSTLDYQKESNTYFDTSEHILVKYSPKRVANPDYIADFNEVFYQYYLANYSDPNNYPDRLHTGTLASPSDFKFWSVNSEDLYGGADENNSHTAGRQLTNLAPGDPDPTFNNPLPALSELGISLNPTMTLRELDSFYFYTYDKQIAYDRNDFITILQGRGRNDPNQDIATYGEPQYWKFTILSGDSPAGVYDAQYDLSLEQNQPTNPDAQRWYVTSDVDGSISFEPQVGQDGSYWLVEVENKMTPIQLTVTSRGLEEDTDYTSEFILDEFNRSLDRIETGDYLVLAFQDKFLREHDNDDWYFGFGQFGEYKANTLNLSTLDQGASKYDPLSGLVHEIAALKINGIIEVDSERKLLKVDKEEVLKTKKKYSNKYDVFNPPKEFLSDEDPNLIGKRYPFATIVKGNGLKSILAKSASSNNEFVPVSKEFNYVGAASRDNIVLLKNMYSDPMFFGPDHQKTAWQERGYRHLDVSSRSVIELGDPQAADVSEDMVSSFNQPLYEGPGDNGQWEAFGLGLYNEGEELISPEGLANTDTPFDIRTVRQVKWKDEFITINKDAFRVGDVSVKERQGISIGSVGNGFSGVYFDPTNAAVGNYFEGEGIFLEPGENNYAAAESELDLTSNTFSFSFNVLDFQNVANNYPITDTSNVEYIAEALQFEAEKSIDAIDPLIFYNTGRVYLRETYITFPGANTAAPIPYVEETERYKPYPHDDYPLLTVNTAPLDVNDLGVVLALVYQDKAVEDGSKFTHCQGVLGYNPSFFHARLASELTLESVFGLESGMAVQFEGYIPDNTYITFVNYETRTVTLSQPTTRDIIANHIITFAPDHNENYEICTVPLNTAPPFEGTNTGLITATSHPTLEMNDLVIENLSLKNQETIPLLDDIQSEKLEIQYIEANTTTYNTRTFDMFFKGATRPYILSSSTSTISEGVPFKITLRTTQENAGSEVAYAVTGITEDDINATASNTATGTFIIRDGGDSSNTGDITFKLAADKITDPGETFTLTLTEHSDVSISIPVDDTSKAPPPPDPVYDLSSNKFAADEGEIIQFNLRTSNLDEGALVPFTITGIQQSDLATGSVTGNFTIGADGSATYEISLSEDAETEGQETLTLSIDNTFVSVSVLIQDTSTGPDYVFQVVPNGQVAYNLTGEDFTGNIFGDNPSLEFQVGDLVEFNVNAPNHPFYIKTANVSGTSNQVIIGVTGQGTQTGTLTWQIQSAGVYYYKCGSHLAMGGVITVNANS